MARKVETVFYHLKVEVEDNDYLPVENKTKWEQRLLEANELRLEILRHTDCDRNVQVVPTVKAVCSFCGRCWTEKETDLHNGGCCDEDAKNMPPE